MFEHTAGRMGRSIRGKVVAPGERINAMLGAVSVVCSECFLRIGIRAATIG
jgi:hypothetical protein